MTTAGTKERCPVYWGSHGCDKPPGHVEAGDVVHHCGIATDCSEMIVVGPENTDGPRNAAVRYTLWTPGPDAKPGTDEGWICEGWSDWGPSRWFT